MGGVNPGDCQQNSDTQTPLSSENRVIKITTFATKVKAGVIPDTDEYQSLNDVDSRLHVIQFTNRIGREHSSPELALNRYHLSRDLQI
jgi:hypothetical protein